MNIDKNDLEKELVRLKQEDVNENKLIKFLGARVSIYFLVIVILALTAIWLYNQIDGIFEPLNIIVNTLITPVLLAYTLFYILKPITKFLITRAKLSPSLAAILSIIFAIAFIIFIFVLGIPVVIEQTQNLITSMPGYIDVVRNYLAKNADNAVVVAINNYINNNFNFAQLGEKAFQIFSTSASSAASTLSSMATILMSAPFVLYYLLKDSDKFYTYVYSLLPDRAKEPVKETFQEIDKKVGSYISGQMLVSLCIGLLLFIGYNIIGLQYAVSLATLAAVLSIVPYLGPILAITPAMLVALATDWVMVLKMLVVWFVVQFLEGNFISPNIMGKTMNQHPLTVLFVIIIATNMMGIVGAIIGIPLYAILKILFIKIVELLTDRYHRIYKGD